MLPFPQDNPGDPPPADVASDQRLRMRPGIRILTTTGFALFLLVGIPVILAKAKPPSTSGEYAVRIFGTIWLAGVCIVIPLSLWCREPLGFILKRVAAGLVGVGFVIGAISAIVDALYATPGQSPDFGIITGLTVVGIPCLVFAVAGRLPKPR